MSDEVSGYPGAPPGWYTDPAGGPAQRWWDGYAWTDTTVHPDPSPPPPPPPDPAPPAYTPPPPYSLPPPPSPYGYGAEQPSTPSQYGAGPPQYGATPPPYSVGQQGAVGHGGDEARALIVGELQLSVVARIALAFPAVLILYDIARAVSNASQWRAYGHQYHLVFEATENHQTVPTLHTPSSLTGGAYGVLVLIGLVAIVFECVWQYRAARMARALRWPAKHAPGWGVVFWFIPIVNFWMPYQALRDCLSPTDPNRSAVARFWLCTVGMEVGAIATFIGLMCSTPVGDVLAVIAGVFAVGVLVTAPRVVAVIALAHRAAVTP